MGRHQGCGFSILGAKLIFGTSSFRVTLPVQGCLGNLAGSGLVPLAGVCSSGLPRVSPSLRHTQLFLWQDVGSNKTEC